MLIAKVIQRIVFGPLRVSEKQVREERVGRFDNCCTFYEMHNIWYFAHRTSQNVCTEISLIPLIVIIFCTVVAVDFYVSTALCYRHSGGMQNLSCS